MDFHNPYDCKWQNTACGLPLPWEEETSEGNDDHVLSEEEQSQNNDEDESISIILQPEESDVWWKLTRRSSCDSNTSITTCDSSQQIEIMLQPDLLPDDPLTDATTTPVTTTSDVFWKLTRRWSYETNTTSATNDSRQVTFSEKHNCIFEVPSRIELFENSEGMSLFLTSDELQKSRAEADTELRLSLSCSDPELSYYSAMNLLFKRPSSISSTFSSSSSHSMYTHNQQPKRHIVILCMDASIVQRKMLLSSIIRDHRAIMSTDVLYLRHSGEYDHTEYEHNSEPLDIVILDETMCIFPDMEDQGKGLEKNAQKGMLDVTTLVGLIKSQHPNCLIVGTVSTVQSSTSAPSSSSRHHSSSLTSSSLSSASSVVMNDLSLFNHHNITCMPIRSDGTSDREGDIDSDSNSNSVVDGDGSTDSESCGDKCSGHHCTSAGMCNNNNNSSTSSCSGGSCSRYIQNSRISCIKKGKDELFLFAGVDVVWNKPITSAWSHDLWSELDYYLQNTRNIPSSEGATATITTSTDTFADTSADTVADISTDTIPIKDIASAITRIQPIVPMSEHEETMTMTIPHAYRSRSDTWPRTTERGL